MMTESSTNLNTRSLNLTDLTEFTRFLGRTKLAQKHFWIVRFKNAWLRLPQDDKTQRSNNYSSKDDNDDSNSNDCDDNDNDNSSKDDNYRSKDDKDDSKNNDCDSSNNNNASFQSQPPILLQTGVPIFWQKFHSFIVAPDPKLVRITKLLGIKEIFWSALTSFLQFRNL